MDSRNAGGAPSELSENVLTKESTKKGQPISPTKGDNIESLSPSKRFSLRSIFKRPGSIRSTDANSDYHDGDSFRSRSMSSLISDTLEPNRTTKTRGNLSNSANIIRPVMSWTKSFNSTGGSSVAEGFSVVGQGHNSEPQKKVHVDEFADTSSENNSSSYFYDAESIQSILDEYVLRDSSGPGIDNKNIFLFKEEFDDTTHASDDQSFPTGEIIGISSRVEPSGALESVEVPSLRDISGPNTRENPENTNDQGHSKAQFNDSQRDTYGTKSSDADTSGRETKTPSTSYAERYPEPNVSDTVTPQGTPKILQKDVNTPRSRKPIDSSLSHKNRVSDRSSLSSGELLNRLEHQDESKRTSDSRSANTSRSIQRDSREPPMSMAAGIDSKSELPFMVYKVQEEGYDESDKRWSVYESFRDSGGNPNKRNEKSSASPLPQSISKTNESMVPNIEDNRGVALSLSPGKQSPVVPYPEPIPEKHLLDSVRKNDTHKNMIHTNDANKLYFNEHSVPHANDDPFQDNGIPFKGDEFNYPEKHDNWEQIRPRGNTRSNLTLILYLIGGLILPPIYFLLALGLFDGHNTQNGLYPYMRWDNQHYQEKRFSKNQKIISFVLGLFWVTVIMAMIAVGFAVGLTRES